MEESTPRDLSRYIIRRRSPDPAKSALLVIDMQKYFLPLAGSILEKVLSLIQVCRDKRVQIIYTRHGHRDISRDGGMLYQWWGESIEYGSGGWELIHGLEVRQGDLILDKKRYSAFHGTDLDRRLRSLGLSELIIAGVLTNCCCETTARDAFVRDYRVFFLSDATASVNRDLHLSSLKNLAFGFAYVMSSTELASRL